MNHVHKMTGVANDSLNCSEALSEENYICISAWFWDLHFFPNWEEWGPGFFNDSPARIAILDWIFREESEQLMWVLRYWDLVVTDSKVSFILKED